MKNRILYILVFFIGLATFGQTPNARSVKFIPQATDIASPTEGQLFYKDTDNTYYYWDGTEWQPLISDQDNTNTVISFSLTTAINENTVATAINNRPLFTITETQTLYILATRRTLSPRDDQTYIYVLKDLGKGDYGTGSGTTIAASDLLYVNNANVNTSTITLDQDTQFIDLGDVGTNDIVTAFNAHTFTGSENPIQQQEEGYVLIDVIINGQTLQYLFVGEGGEYGTGGTETAITDDFVLLTDVNIIEDTQFIELGEVGETEIQDAFNAHTFTGGENPVQEQEEGYVIVNTLIDGVQVQYLFVGEGGEYGTGGSETAIADDFVIYAPYVAPRTNYTWTVAGSGISNTGVPSYSNTGIIWHNGQIRVRKVWVDGLGGIQNKDSDWLRIFGNQGINLISVNPNLGHTRVTTSGAFTSFTGNNDDRYNMSIGRQYNEGNTHTNTRFTGVEINDVVDITNSDANSYYASLRINPTLSGTGKHYSILSERGDVEFKNGAVTFNDYTFPTSDGTSNQVLQTDGSGNVTWQTVSGSGSSSATTTADISTDSFEVDINNVNGNYCNMLSASDADSGDTIVPQNGVVGGFAKILINSPSEPNIGASAAEEIGGIFIPDTDIYLIIYYDADGYKYFWSYKGTAPVNYEYIQIACSDLTTDITTGATKGYLPMPYDATFIDATVNLLIPGSSTGIEVDILKNGTTTLSTPLTTDATENTSTTATTSLVISETDLQKDDAITFDFNTVPVGAKSVVITLKVIKQ